LACIDGDWFLVGYCHLREEVRMLAPGRIRGMRGTDVRFDRPPEFRIAEYLDVGLRKLRGTASPQTVVLRFAPGPAGSVRGQTCHPTQQLEEGPDGHLIIRFQVNHLLEVKRWVLSFGAECEVLAPDELRQAIDEEVKAMLSRGTPNRRGEEQTHASC